MSPEQNATCELNEKPTSDGGGFALTGQRRWQASNAYQVQRWRNGENQVAFDAVIVETSVPLSYNDESHVVMLAIFLDLEDFAEVSLINLLYLWVDF